VDDSRRNLYITGLFLLIETKHGLEQYYFSLNFSLFLYMILILSIVAFWLFAS